MRTILKSLQVRTWVEIDVKSLKNNLEQFLKLISKSTRFMAIVKSNAYGHGLVLVAKQLASLKFKVKGSKLLWFGVDSMVEALRLRRDEIKNPILVLGSTLPARMKEASTENIILTISNFDSLAALAKLKIQPRFHIKIDTGMHRQGFLLHEVFKLIKLLKKFGLKPAGVYTHFASKDWGYPAYTGLQLVEFKKALKFFERAGFSTKGGSAPGGKSLVRHAAASDATLLFPETHLDMVRVGMGLYGCWPSWVAKIKHPPQMRLRPVFTWKTVVSETKEIFAGSYVGYDITEEVHRKTKIAVLPIGYWHGYDRGLSSIGEVLIKGKRAKILGRVSMDMFVVDITDIPKVKVGDEVVLIGKQSKDAIWADELSLKIGTTPYEFLTRINPLIKRIIV